MKIMVIHQYFLTQGDSGGSRWNQFAKYFTQAGHEVTVIAGMVNYTSGRKARQYKNKFIVCEKEHPGLTVYRCHVSESYNKSFIGRTWAYLSFFLPSAYAVAMLASRPDVIIATSPPLTVAPTLWWAKWRHRVPTVFEVRDLWPESAVDTGVLTNKFMIDFLYRMEANAYRRADWINVLTPAFQEALNQRKRVPLGKISMIPNGADLDIMLPGPKENAVRRELGLEGKFVVSYFGAHGRANRVGQLLDVAAKVKNVQDDIRILLVGDGMEKDMLVERAKKQSLSNVIFVNSVSKEEVCNYINASDVCTAVLMKNDTFKTVYPNKVFDYMCCRKPVIIGIDGAARSLVEDAGAGIFAEPENTQAFISALVKLKENPSLMAEMGESGYNHASQQYSRRAMAEKYLDVLQSLVRAK